MTKEAKTDDKPAEKAEEKKAEEKKDEAPPKKFLGRFDSEEAAAEAFAKIETERAQYEGVVKAVKPYFEDDGQGNVRLKREEKEREEANPDLAVERKVDAKLSQREKMETSSHAQQSNLRKTYGKKDEFFDEHLSKVEDMASRASLAQKSSPGFWDGVYKLVIADNLESIIERKVKAATSKKSDRERQLNDSSVEGGGGKGPGGNGLPELSDAQRKVADNLGVSYEKYAKRLASRNPR